MLYERITSATHLKAIFQSYDRDYYTYEFYEWYIDFCEEFKTELDVIAVCCEFSEYTQEEAVEAYFYDASEETKQNLLNIDLAELADLIEGGGSFFTISDKTIVGVL